MHKNVKGLLLNSELFILLYMLPTLASAGPAALDRMRAMLVPAATQPGLGDTTGAPLTNCPCLVA